MGKKITKLLFLLYYMTILGCSNNPMKLIDNEIALLTSTEEKKIYLENIFKDDQKVRGSLGQEILWKYGKGSLEYKSYYFRQREQDSVNLIKIDRYLTKYEYPRILEMGGIAASTPWTVIHHSASFEIRDKYFETIYLAYLNQNISKSALSMYLNRMYQIKFNKSFEIKSPYTSNDEIVRLTSELSLTQRKIAVEKAIESSN